MSPDTPWQPLQRVVDIRRRRLDALAEAVRERRAELDACLTRLAAATAQTSDCIRRLARLDQQCAQAQQRLRLVHLFDARRAALGEDLAAAQEQEAQARAAAEQARVALTDAVQTWLRARMRCDNVQAEVDALRARRRRLVEQRVVEDA